MEQLLVVCGIVSVVCCVDHEDSAVWKDVEGYLSLGTDCQTESQSL